MAWLVIIGGGLAITFGVVGLAVFFPFAFVMLIAYFVYRDLTDAFG